MKTYSLKCIYEGSEIAFLDINISDNKTLKELHEVLIQSLGFSGDQLAAFYEINEDFEVINEIGLVDFMSKEQQMETVLVSDVIQKLGDQILYTYDFLNEHKFTIECMEVIETKEVQLKLMKKYGKFPKESNKTISNEEAESILLNAIMGEEFEENDDDLFEDDNFESLDDYEGLI